MRRRKLRIRKWVRISSTALLIAVIMFGLFQVITVTNSSLNDKGNYVIKALLNNSKPVISENENLIIKPFEEEKATISKYYYNKDDNTEKQQQSLIFYENIYLQNTGVLYSADEEFDVVAMADGIVKNIKRDKLLGDIIEIESSENLTILYQSVDNITVKVGDQIEKGNIIATSGNNSLSNEKDNCLHIEVFLKGKLTNPESIIGKDFNSLND